MGRKEEGGVGGGKIRLLGTQKEGLFAVLVHRSCIASRNVCSRFPMLLQYPPTGADFYSSYSWVHF